MLTCQSPRKVLLVAYQAARRVLPNHVCKFGRHDFTSPQLFACLVLREHQKKSYRGLEALLRDVHWGQEISLRKVPDHSTLCRAFHAIMSGPRVEGMLDLLAQWLLAPRDDAALPAVPRRGAACGHAGGGVMGATLGGVMASEDRLRPPCAGTAFPDRTAGCVGGTMP